MIKIWMWTRMELQMSLYGADISGPLSVIQHGCAWGSEKPHVTQTQKKDCVCVCVCVCVRVCVRLSVWTYCCSVSSWASCLHFVLITPSPCKTCRIIFHLKNSLLDWETTYIYNHATAVGHVREVMMLFSRNSDGPLHLKEYSRFKTSINTHTHTKFTCPFFSL